ncbi:MAG: L-threonylcarbamoyladenylate synthase [Gemmatimonadetes bacterium]|nr:L-threonylcarbamoyladenylate synthase [Gemmatimonadota bacterium]
MVSPGPTVMDLRGADIDSMDLGGVADHVRGGGLAAYPTETVYGLGGLCTPKAVARLRALKRREPEKPFIAVVRGVDDVAGLSWTAEARELARIFWPGALTLVLGDPDGVFPPGVRSPAGSVAVRVSPHPLVARLLAAVAAPLTSTSANVPGESPARSGTEALEVARTLGAGPEMWVLDAGTLPPSGPSTVIDCTNARCVVIREGTVPLGRLRCVLPEIHGR